MDRHPSLISRNDIQHFLADRLRRPRGGRNDGAIHRLVGRTLRAGMGSQGSSVAPGRRLDADFASLSPAGGFQQTYEACLPVAGA
jgi:hypothetical protein